MTGVTYMRQRKARKVKRNELPDVREWFNGTFVAVPSSMAKALSVAAEATGMTAAEYVRRSVYLRMRADGVREEDDEAA
jgi:hypothetical protein